MTKPALKGEHQNITRSSLVLDVISRTGESGARLIDICEETGLGKATTHRLTNGLLANGLVELDEDTGRYFVGMRLLAWSRHAGKHHGLRRVCGASLTRLSARTTDTVYLSLKVGDQIVCAARSVGSFPIKTLVFEEGDRRPLGVGAGSLALLSFLPDTELRRVYPTVVSSVAQYGIDDASLSQMISATRDSGYAFEDETVVPGMRAVALPVFKNDDLPVAAISVTAISARLESARRREIIDYIREEIERIYAELANRGIVADSTRVRRGTVSGNEP